MAVTGAHIERLLRAGRTEEAVVAAQALLCAEPASSDGLFLLARALQQRGDGTGALQTAERALAAAPEDPQTLLLWAEVAIPLGHSAEAIARLHRLAVRDGLPAALRQRTAQLLTHLNQHREAEHCHAQCVREAPADPHYLYNWAAALTAVGRLDAAEAAYDNVLRLAPDDCDAYYNRATLRTQTAARNHVAQIEARLALTPAEDPRAIALNYALAKELEDLGDYARAFAALKRGADGRRRRLSYRVESDVETMGQIAAHFNAEWLAHAGEGCSDPRPIFVVGLPRSGTTLVDRILSSHSEVESRGESSDLAAAVSRIAAPARDKSELIGRAVRAEPRELGLQYCRTLATSRPRVIDKTPLNFLYVGLMLAALPRARIVHVRRGALDVCYAMYKTLFRMAYPFTYSLEDLGQYYLAYERLMTHWRGLAPEAVCEIRYEDLVSDQEGVSRRVLAHCGLSWQPQCLSFERNASPTLTASAAQVRQPIYSSSIGLWRRYATQLEPLRAQFRAAGIAAE